MTSNGGRAAGLSERGEDDAEVRPVELFFDLVYVLAITQLTHHLVTHLSPRGAVETLLLLLAVWAAWSHVAWSTDYFDRDARPVRLVLIGLMLASLIMSASLPEAFAGRGLAFAVALVTITVGGTAVLLFGIGLHHHLGAVLERILIWWSAIGVLWLVGGIATGNVRVALWLAAVALVYLVMWLGFPVPGLGRSRTTDYTIAGEHLAERCRLFVILALGESILITGTGFGELPGSAATVAAFVVAFVGSVAMWWIYFDRAEAAARRIIAAVADPGRLALSAYTYVHVPMVAGIIVAAAADELTIAHPTDQATVASTVLILGGPALYLVGNALFKRTLWGHVPRSRPLAVGALAALVPVAVVSSALVLLVAATLVLVGLALSDVRAERVGRGRVHAPAPSAAPAQASIVSRGLPGRRRSEMVRDARWGSSTVLAGEPSLDDRRDSDADNTRGER